MNADAITIVTPTFGNSADRLSILLRELRAFTNLPFQQLVCDDGTICQHAIANQRMVCASHQGCTYLENPGPTYGVSYNLNHAFDQVKTPWAFCVEDGLRPGAGWLETAVDFLDKIGNRQWQGRRVGMAGCASLQDWNLVMGGAWAGDVMRVFEGDRSCFYNDYNDGLWCWRRLLPGMMAACLSPASAHWQRDVLYFKKLALEGVQAIMQLPDVHPTDVEQAWQKWRTTDHWPSRRTAWCGWYPGAFMLVNMDAWRRVGRFRDGCSFFEGHLGVRMGMAGYLSLCVEFPPWLHCPSQGFSASAEGKTPRVHLDTEKVFREDFQGWSNMDAPNVLATGVVSMDTQRRVNDQLAGVELWMAPGWKDWL